MTIEEQFAPYVKQLHDQMRAMYGIPPLNVLSLAKLKEVKKDVYLGHPPEMGHDGYGGRVLSRAEEIKFAEDLDRAMKGKTLLPKPHPAKPHPEGCICRECLSKRGNVLPSAVRIGDSERNQALALLDERLASGHITLAEFQSRADSALAATMKDELDYLTRDLPAEKKKIVPVPPDPARAPPVVMSALVAGSIFIPALSGIMLFAGASQIGIVVALALASLASLVLSFLR